MINGKIPITIYTSKLNQIKRKKNIFFFGYFMLLRRFDNLKDNFNQQIESDRMEEKRMSLNN